MSLPPYIPGLIAVLCGIISTGLAAEPGSILIAPHASWQFFAGKIPPAAGWSAPSFDDSEWKSGQAGFGYGDGDDLTVLRDMAGNYLSVYLRARFESPRTATDRLYLHVNFDDGFVAYLNGVEVARAAVSRVGGQVRVDQHEALGFETFVLTDVARLLQPGQNVLAIEGHNASLGSSDFSLDPFLTTKPFSDLLDAEDFRADLAELEHRLRDQSAYWKRHRVNEMEAIGAIRDAIEDDLPLNDFVAGLRKYVMELGDCHADVTSGLASVPELALPLRLADTDAGVIALHCDRDELLNPEHPFVSTLDGVPFQQWLAAAAQYVPRGSSQLIRRQSLRWMGRVHVLRRELKLPVRDRVSVGLRSLDGADAPRQELPLARRPCSVAELRTGPSGLLDGDIGYLPIPRMDDALIERTVRSIQQFRDTAGLILDVRGNGGGTYRLLHAIYGYFVPADAAPYVTNIAAYRVSSLFRRDHLAYRPTYRSDWPQWNAAERAAIRQAAASFRPEWTLPDGEFSDWHYMVLSRDRGARPRSEYFHYDKPVVVLCDAGSFSATDGFLSAFAELPQVTLMGEPSGGGSGAVRQFILPRTLIKIAVSSMASFRPNGQMYDGRGIEVDVAVRPTLEDFTTGSDSVRQRALDFLRRHTGM